MLRNISDSTRLLGLVDRTLFHLLFSCGLGLRAGLGVETVVPPPEGRGVIADKIVVMEVVVLGSGPEGQDLVQRPREVVARVRVDSLEQSASDPNAEREEMQLSREHHVDDRHTDGAEPQGHRLHRVRVLGSHAEGCRVSVMLLVDVLVEHSVMEQPVGPVVPDVLQNEKQRDFQRHFLDAREGHRHRNTQLLAQRMERPNGDRLHQKVRQQHRLEAVPLLLHAGQLGRLQLVPSEPRNLVDDKPRQRSEEIHKLVQQEKHQPGGQDVVVHEHVPRRPIFFHQRQLRLQLEHVGESLRI